MADRTVRVVLDAVTAAYEAKMAKAGVTTKGVAGAMDDLGSRGSAALNQMSGGMVDLTGKTAAVAGGVAIAGAAVLKFLETGIRGYTELADRVDTYQDIAGGSAEDASRMIAIADQLGVSTDTLAGGMVRLSRNISTNADGLREQGIEIARTKDGQVDLSETLFNVADAYRAAGSGVAGNAVAQAAFGRSFAGMIDILERGRGELAEFQRKAEELGLILTDEDLQTVRDFNASIVQAQMAFMGLAVAGSKGLVPVLADVLDGLTEVVVKVNELKDSTIGGWIGDAVKFVAEGTPAGQVVSLLADLGDGGVQAADGTKKAAEEQRDLNEELTTGADVLSQYSTALDAVIGRMQGVDSAAGSVQSDLADLAANVAEAKEAGDQWATSLDATNTTGLANRETLRNIAAGAAEVARAMVAAGEDPTAAMQTLHTNLLATLETLGFNREKAADFLSVILRLPADIDIVVNVDTANAEERLQRLLRLIQINAHGIDVLEQERWAMRSGNAASPIDDTFDDLGKLPAAPPDTDKGPEPPTAEELRAEADRRMRARANAGDITTGEYKAYLEDRLAATERFTSEWETLWGEVDRVNDQIGQGWTDAAEAMQAMEDAWWEILDRQHEVGRISTDDYLAQLERRLGGLQEFSDEWMRVWREIESIRDEGSQHLLELIQAVEEQRLYDQAFYGLVHQRDLSASRLTPVDPSPIVVRGGDTYSRSITASISTTDGQAATDTRRALRHLSYELG